MPVSHRGMSPGSPYNDMSGAPVTGGSAVQSAGDPYAKSYANFSNAYPSWQQEETPVTGTDRHKSNPDYQNDGARAGYTHEEFAFYGRRDHASGPTRPNHIVMVNDLAEHTVWADEGPMSKDPTPVQDGFQTNEPNNNSGKWSVANYGRYLRAGIGYMFLRNWTENQRDEQGFSGDHISMSDNAVILPVGGMRPNYERNKRNTYRVEPEPWDLNFVDLSADPYNNASSPTIPMVPPNVSGTSYRLG